MFIHPCETCLTKFENTWVEERIAFPRPTRTMTELTFNNMFDIEEVMTAHMKKPSDEYVRFSCTTKREMILELTVTHGTGNALKFGSVVHNLKFTKKVGAEWTLQDYNGDLFQRLSGELHGAEEKMRSIRRALSVFSTFAPAAPAARVI